MHMYMYSTLLISRTYTISLYLQHDPKRDPTGSNIKPSHGYIDVDTYEIIDVYL